MPREWRYDRISVVSATKPDFPKPDERTILVMRGHDGVIRAMSMACPCGCGKRNAVYLRGSNAPESEMQYSLSVSPEDGLPTIFQELRCCGGRRFKVTSGDVEWL